MAIQPTITDFRARFPEFNAVDDTIVQLNLNDAIDFISETKFGDKYAVVTLFYSAHLLALSQKATASMGQGAPGGPITSSSAGGLSVSFASAVPTSTSESWFLSTSYGQRFLQYVRACTSTVSIAGSQGY